ncbi:AMSH-like ubiquitin thioesterase 3 [Lolium perenne]|uniref:AMSH-like ubiquitin thioesterase 3 n=1 Tax=Lolium perenne TaxID=4522 RepID=UPI003A99644F
MAMTSPRRARVYTSIEELTRPVAVDHRISLPHYFRIADNLLRQANIYREERNLVDWYIILLRYLSLLSETIPMHRDYHAFKSREKEFLKKGPYDKLWNVIGELESLKPIVKQQIAELNRGAAEEPKGQGGTYAGNGASSRMVQLAPSPPLVQVYGKIKSKL